MMVKISIMEFVSDSPDYKHIVSSLENRTKYSQLKNRTYESFAFNVYEYPISTLVQIGMIIAQQLSIDKLIPINKIKNLLIAASKLYNMHDYHNFHHAIDVTQFCYNLLKLGKFREISLNDRALLFISCLCHDLDHPGLTIDYQIKRGIAKDIDTLEKHHFTVATNLLKTTGILEHLTYDDMLLVYDLIISTNMKRHKQIYDEINSDGGLSKKLLMIAIIKLSDLCSSFRPFALAEEHGKRLCREFYRQGDLEKKHGFNDIPDCLLRSKAAEFIKLQLEFLKDIPLAFITKLAECHNAVVFLDLKLSCKLNIIGWSKVKVTATATD